MFRETEPGTTPSSIDEAADRLVALYDHEFGGRPRGRYRISMKHLRQVLGRRRVYPEDVGDLGRALYERGYVLVDMESFIVVLSPKTFTSYRRVNEACLS